MTIGQLHALHTALRNHQFPHKLKDTFVGYKCIKPPYMCEKPDDQSQMDPR